jgi:hypothetical protein
MNNGFTFSQNDTLTHKEKEEIGLLENIYGIYSIASDIPFYVNQMLSFSGVSSYDSKQLNKITETINSSFLEANFTNQTYNIFITRLEEKHNEEINKILVSNQFQNVTNKELTLVSTSDKQNFTKYLIANFNNPIFINRKQVVSGYIKNTTKSKNITKLVYSIQDLIIKLYDKKDQVQPLRNLSTEMITIIEENYVNELLYKYQNISLSDLQNYFSLFDTEIMKSINLLQIDAFNYALDKVETIVENKIKEIK